MFDYVRTFSGFDDHFLILFVLFYRFNYMIISVNFEYFDVGNVFRFNSISEFIRFNAEIS